MRGPAEQCASKYASIYISLSTAPGIIKLMEPEQSKFVAGEMVRAMKALKQGMPKLYISGTKDRLGTKEDIEKLLMDVAEPKEVTYLDGAQHDLAGHEEKVADLLVGFVLRHFPTAAVP